MKLTKKNLALLALCIVALGYALLSVVARLMSGGAEPFTQVYIRVGIAFLLALILFNKSLSFKKFKRLPAKDWLLLVLMGTFGYGFAVYLITLGALNTKLLNVAVISSTIPFFVFLFSLFFLREHVSKKVFFLLAVSFYGVWVVSTKSILPVLDNFGYGEMLVLISSAGFALYAVCRKLLSDTLNNKEITVAVMLISFVSCFAGAMFMKETFVIASFSDPYFLLGIFMGVSFNIIATLLNNFSFQQLNPIVATQVLLLENVFAPILGFLLYQETILSVELFGAGIIIVGVLAANKFSTK